MGLGKGIWEHLGAVKVTESLSYLRDKKLAIDLSFWLIQQQKATKGNHVRKPHIRLTFFRVVNLISQVGARLVFVVDGDPPALKKAGQEKRSNILCSAPERQLPCCSTFKENVEECVVLLKHLGVPVLRAKGEAESLCAELNRQGLVDACVTPDSDTFVHGAKCVIKNLQVDRKDPLVELYQATDIKEKLGLEQNHLLALALLVGCDYNPEGVSGVGFNSALRLVQGFPESEILDRLRAWGQGELPLKAEVNQDCDADNSATKNLIKCTHCSKCGHPGNKGGHVKTGCQTCAGSTIQVSTIRGCNQKSKGFKCNCSFCTEEVHQKEQKRSRDWWMKICCKLETTPGFPNENIIDIFLKRDVITPEDAFITWQPPNMEELESFLGKHLFWDATYVRRKTFPLLSHLYLTELAAMNSSTLSTLPMGLINDLFCPQSILRIKIDHSEKLYVLKWDCGRKGQEGEQWLRVQHETSHSQILENVELVTSKKREKTCKLGVATFSTSKIDHGSFITYENMALVRAACPKLTEVYDRAQATMQVVPKKQRKRKREEESEAGGQ